MATYLPISKVLPQFLDANGDPYSGAVLKAYQVGTTTNISFATDNTGGTTAATITLNASGYPEVSAAQVIPHLDQDYKLALYPTQAAANSDSGAIYTIDNITSFPTDLNNAKLTSVGNGTARTDAINVGQVQDGQFTSYGTTAGSADAYTLALSPAITAYVATMRFSATIHATNATTTPYLQFNGIALPASTAVITKFDGTGSEVAVDIGDMVASQKYVFERNTANGGFILMNPERITTAASSTSAKGITYIPNQITVVNGTDADHDIDFSAGNFAFSGGDGQALASALTKQLDAEWAAGTNAGGLANSLTIANDTIYYCFALSSADGSTVDFGFDTSLVATTLLADADVVTAGLTKYKRIGTILTDGSANIDTDYIGVMISSGQETSYQDGEYATTSTSIPFDDTKPQNTEGAEFISALIAPTNAGSKLRIDVVICCQFDNDVGIAALFQDSTADALAVACAVDDYSSTASMETISFTHHMIAGSTAATTFKVRCGSSGTNFYFNGTAGARRFGGVSASSITITEIIG